MFTPDQYELLDFGGGRRLERFGGVTLDRPSPAVEKARQADPAAWDRADARFDRTDAGPSSAGCPGTWTFRRKLPEHWTIVHGPLVLEVRPTVFGQVGVFPEQAENWDWIARGLSQFSGHHAQHGRENGTVPLAPSPPPSPPGTRSRVPLPRERGEPLRVLHLFAYTGGSTLAAAAAGAEVTHVDAARNIVAWARRNAEASGLAAAPIRWIVEDAAKFVKREIRRGNRYEVVILDPPSYGHGPHGQVWRLAKHLQRLIEWCGLLTDPQRRLMLLSCHTPGFSPQRLRELVAEALGENGRITAEPLVLRTADGRQLPSGAAVRWEGPARPNGRVDPV